jgi:hypothetical protein
VEIGDLTSVEIRSGRWWVPGFGRRVRFRWGDLIAPVDRVPGRPP